MNAYLLRQGEIDPSFWEVKLGEKVIREIRIVFPLKKVPPFFKTLEEIEPWLKKEEYRLAKGYALWLLNRRSYSKKMLIDKLLQKKYSIAEKIADEMDQYGYLPDDLLAASIVRRKEMQGYGPRYITQYLKERGLKAPLEFNELEAIQKWIPKLQKKERSKAIAFLLRKGFSLQTIQLAL